jgi:phosphoglycolate phosphatase
VIAEGALLTTQFQRNVLLVDLDGTLTNPAEGIIGCFRFALCAMGCAAPPGADLGWIIGPPLRQSFTKFLGGTADAEEALAIYRTRYGAKGLFEAIAYDGAPEALAALRQSGARLFLCTSKPTVYANRILARFHLGGYFEEAYGSELDGRLEDKGDLIAHILAGRGLDPAECVMWGDRKHDVAGAKRHAIPTIGALWGFGGEKELREAGAAALCAAPDEVSAAFDRIRASRPHVKSRAHDQ